MDARLTDLLTTTAVENAHVTHSQLYNALKGVVRDHLPNELAVEDTVHQFLVKNDYIMPEETRRQVYRATYQYRHRPTLEQPEAAKARLADAPIRAFGPQEGTYGHFIEQVADAIQKGATNPAQITWAAWAAELVMSGTLGLIDFTEGHYLRGPLTAPYLFANGNKLGDRDGKFVVRHSDQSLAGSFVHESGTAPVKSGLDFTTTDADRNKMAVIVGFADELKEQTTPQIEQQLRDSILWDTLAAYDHFLYDTGSAVPTVRPAAINADVDVVDSVDKPLKDLETLYLRSVTHKMRSPVMVFNPVMFNRLSHRWADEYMTDELNKIHAEQSFKDIPILQSEKISQSESVVFDLAMFQYRLAPMEWDISDKALLAMADDDGYAPTMLAVGAVDDTGSIHISNARTTTPATQLRSLLQTYSSAVRMIHRVSWLMADSSATLRLRQVNWRV